MSKVKGAKPEEKNGTAAGAVTIPEPTDAAQVQQFLAACNWVRGKILHYSEIFAPLQQLLQDALKGLRRRNKESARRVALDSVGLSVDHSQCFTTIKEALTDAVRLAHPRSDFATSPCRGL